MALMHGLGNPLTTRWRRRQTDQNLIISLRDMLAIATCIGLLLAGCTSELDRARRQAAIAQSELEAGDIDAAKNSIARAISYRDDQPEILIIDARVKFLSGDFAEALEAYRTVLALKPNDLEALSAVSQLGVRTGLRDIARNAIRRALALDPHRPEVLLSQGILQIEGEDYKGAIATGDRLLAAHPGDSRGIVLKSRALFLSNRRDESLSLLNHAAENRGNDQWIAAALLENARAAGNVPLMLEQFELLSEANPKSVDLALDEINTLYKSGRKNAAHDRSRAFVERFGNDEEDMTALANLWSEYDRAPLDSAAVRWLAKSNRVAARLAASRFYLGHDQATLARTFVQHDPDARFMGLIARFHVRDGAAVGRDMARTILAKDTTNCDALTALIEWDLRRANFEAAVLNGQLLATQCTDRIDGYQLQASAYRSLGRPTAVERVYRDGIEAHPQDPIITGEFAKWLLSVGRNEAAVSAVRRLSKVAPSRLSTWRLFQQICREADANCDEVATEGLDRAKTQYSLDPLPGVRPTDQLFGRSWM